MSLICVAVACSAETNTARWPSRLNTTVFLPLPARKLRPVIVSWSPIAMFSGATLLTVGTDDVRAVAALAAAGIATANASRARASVRAVLRIMAVPVIGSARVRLTMFRGRWTHVRVTRAPATRPRSCPALPRARSPGARGSSRSSCANACAAARYTAWRSVTRSDAATRAVPAVSPAGADATATTATSSRARTVRPGAPGRSSRVTSTSTRPPGTTWPAGAAATTSATRSPFATARAGRGAAARRADERGQQLLAGGDVSGQPHPDERARVGDGAARRVARGHLAHGQRLAPDRAPGREPRPGDDDADARAEALAQRRLARRDVGCRQPAEQQREPGEQQRPATAGHRAIPSAGSSSPIRAPRADGAGASRPP